MCAVGKERERERCNSFLYIILHDTGSTAQPLSPLMIGRTMREPSGSSAQKYSLSPTAARRAAWLLIAVASPAPPAVCVCVLCVCACDQICVCTHLGCLNTQSTHLQQPPQLNLVQHLHEHTPKHTCSHVSAKHTHTHKAHTPAAAAPAKLGPAVGGSTFRLKPAASAAFWNTCVCCVCSCVCLCYGSEQAQKHT